MINAVRIYRYFYIGICSLASLSLIGCADDRSHGKLTESLFYDSLWSYKPVVYVLPFLFFLLSLWLAEFCREKADRSVALVTFYAFLNWAIYKLMSRYFDFDQGGVYLSYCINILIGLLMVTVARSTYLVLKRRRNSSDRITTNLLLVFLLFLSSYWLGVTYRLGAGECFQVGRALTPYENIMAMTNARLKHSPPETKSKNEEIALKTIKDIYQEFVSKYQLGLYREALDELPFFDRAPDGNYQKYFDNYLDRVVRGTAYAKFEFKVFYENKSAFSEKNRLAYLVTNCGDAKFLEFPKSASKRKSVMWSK